VGLDNLVRIASERSECLLGLLAVAIVMNDHARSLAGELSRGGAPDALGGAGDQDDFVFEIHGSSENRAVFQECSAQKLIERKMATKAQRRTHQDVICDMHDSYESNLAVSSARFIGALFFLSLDLTSPLNQCLSRDAQEFRDFRAGLVLRATGGLFDQEVEQHRTIIVVIERFVFADSNDEAFAVGVHVILYFIAHLFDERVFDPAREPVANIPFRLRAVNMTLGEMNPGQKKVNLGVEDNVGAVLAGWIGQVIRLPDIEIITGAQFYVVI